MISAITAFAFEKKVNRREARAACLGFAADKLKPHPAIGMILRHSTREMIFHTPAALDNGAIEAFIGFHVHHSIVGGPAKGGISCDFGVSVDRAGALASRMRMADYTFAVDQAASLTGCGACMPDHNEDIAHG